ncbi:hypothetical protein [Anaeromicropila populeti]|uniref:Uncharacterized protein n=1 Tax=Anaeromicropila populeti TaxID=37658 RepID=A0A1I6IAX2_9FIRM|nr:hypothetical protein [Anaeromicropila populeti]SFR63833.1 hypothetical protein SAMN05661086_00633 [Anaeromicropila populeti]
MAETILCSNENEVCNCSCNCHAFLSNSRKITAGPLVIDGSQYDFQYTITNQDPAISNVVFCIQCQVSTIQISSSNTSVEIIGNPATTPVPFTECFSSGCQSASPNRFYVEYDFGEEDSCCFYQGLKVEVNPADTITELEFHLIFTLPEDVTFGFQPGTLRLKDGQNIEIVNDLCMPGCTGNCSMKSNVCQMWILEKNILESDKSNFVHFGQLIFPDALDLNTLTIEELEKRIRTIAKLEKCSANLICNIACVLNKLNKLDSDSCDK